MEVTLVGKKKVNFTNKDTGEVITGTSLHFTYDGGLNTSGLLTDKVFVKPEKMPRIDTFPAPAEIYWNKYGKVDEIKLV